MLSIDIEVYNLSSLKNDPFRDKFSEAMSMKFRAIVCLAFFLTLQIPVFGQMPNWYSKLQQIRLFQSTKRDLEGLFPGIEVTKSQSFERNTQVFYRWKNDDIIAFYSTGKCPTETKKGYQGYDVEADVIVGIIYRTEKGDKLSKLKLDLTAFEMYKDSDTENYTYYNFDYGIRYFVSVNKLEGMEIFPANSTKSLQCGDY